MLPISGKTNYTLARDIVRIVSVRNRQTGQTYTPGTDYTATNGQFVIPAGSQIPGVPASWTSTPPDSNQYNVVRSDGTPIRVSHDYQYHQIAVTYEGKAYGGTYVNSAGAQTTLAKLAAGQRVAITFVGDSITYGSDTTWELNIEPRQRGWADLVSMHLASLHSAQLFYRNWAIPSTVSLAGSNMAASSLGDTPSDLVVVAYGMNDAGLGVSGADFETHLRTMISAARTANPNAEVVLVCSWPSNPEASPLNWMPLGWYYSAINRIAYDTPGVLIANMTSATWDYLLTRKSFYDITANGVNHPSDWMHTVYAQIVLGTILGIAVPN